MKVRRYFEHFLKNQNVWHFHKLRMNLKIYFNIYLMT
jgi:hypothetical protein